VSRSMAAPLADAVLPALKARYGQWEFSEYLVSPAAKNWFFAGSQFFTFADAPGEHWHRFWRLGVDPVNARGLLIALALAAVSSGAGLAVGNWMSKVKR